MRLSRFLFLIPLLICNLCGDTKKEGGADTSNRVGPSSSSSLVEAAKNNDLEERAKLVESRTREAALGEEDLLSKEFGKKDEDGKTAMDRAIELKNDEMLRLFINNGASKEDTSLVKEGVSLGIEKDNLDIVRAFWCEDFSAPDQRGFFDKACDNKSTGSLKYLLREGDIEFEEDVLEDADDSIKPILRERLFQKIAKDGKVDAKDVPILSILSVDFNEVKDKKIVDRLELSDEDKAKIGLLLSDSDALEFQGSKLVKEHDGEEMVEFQMVKALIDAKAGELIKDDKALEIVKKIGDALATNPNLSKKKILKLIPNDVDKAFVEESLNKIIGKSMKGNYETAKVSEEMRDSKKKAFYEFSVALIKEYFVVYDMIERGVAERERTFFEEAVFTAGDIATIFLPLTGENIVEMGKMFIDEHLDSRAREKAAKIRTIHGGIKKNKEKYAKHLAASLLERYQNHLDKLSFQGIESFAEVTICYMFGYFLENSDKYVVDDPITDQVKFLTKFTGKEVTFRSKLKKIKYILLDDIAEIDPVEFLSAIFTNIEDDKEESEKKAKLIDILKLGALKLGNLFDKDKEEKK